MGTAEHIDFFFNCRQVLQIENVCVLLSRKGMWMDHVWITTEKGSRLASLFGFWI